MTDSINDPSLMSGASTTQDLQDNSLDLHNELLDLIQATKTHIEFYREMGITHVEQFIAQRATSKSLEDNMVKKRDANPDAENQGALFDLGDSVAPPKKDMAKASALPIVTETLPDIRKEIGHCCNLCPNATQAVFGEGSAQAELMFIGEAPGADEDALGRPFVGAAGKLLDKIIEAIGMKRQDVYISNIVKCRPPQNRKPTDEEMAACEPFVFREINVVRPKIIVTLGATPLYSLLRIHAGITKIRGNFYSYHGIPVMPTFHPAYLLRVPERKREVWSDMKQVMAKLQEIKSGLSASEQ